MLASDLVLKSRSLNATCYTLAMHNWTAEFIGLSLGFQALVVLIFLFAIFLVVIAAQSVYLLIAHRRRIGFWRGVAIAFLIILLGERFVFSPETGGKAFAVFVIGFGIYTMMARRRLQAVASSAATSQGATMSYTDRDGVAITKFCRECGEPIRANAEICPKCGVRQLPVPTAFGATPSGRSRLAAALFALLLGGLGIHKFYLGRIGQGILYLLFCWTFIPVIVGFIEGIVYLTMSNDQFARKYG